MTTSPATPKHAYRIEKVSFVSPGPGRHPCTGYDRVWIDGDGREIGRDATYLTEHAVELLAPKGARRVVL